MVRGGPRGPVNPGVLVAVRVAWRGEFGGSVVGFEGLKVMGVAIVMMMRQSVRQAPGRVGHHDGKSQGGGEQTPEARATHGQNNSPWGQA